VAGFFKCIAAGHGLRVPVKELALGVDAQPTVRFRMLIAGDAVWPVLTQAGAAQLRVGGVLEFTFFSNRL
jgi:hypothetical protein